MEHTKEVLERAKKAIEIGTAILQGKEIEWAHPNSENWNIIYEPALNFQTSDYRVKPEPKYVPFTFEDAKDLIGKAVKSEELVCIITSIDDEGNMFFGGQSHFDFKELLNDFKFLDGTPCGKLENQ